MGLRSALPLSSTDNGLANPAAVFGMTTAGVVPNSDVSADAPNEEKPPGQFVGEAQKKIKTANSKLKELTQLGQGLDLPHLLLECRPRLTLDSSCNGSIRFIARPHT